MKHINYSHFPQYSYHMPCASTKSTIRSSEVVYRSGFPISMMFMKDLRRRKMNYSYHSIFKKLVTREDDYKIPGNS